MAKFFRRGKSKIVFLPACASLAAPTRLEITAGTQLSAGVADVSGWSLSNSPIPTPDLATIFTSQIQGEDTVPDCTLTFNDDDASTTIRDALEKGTEGFILLLPYGDVATERCEVWPITTTGVNDEWSVGNDPAKFVVGCAITSTPQQNAVVPAA